MANQKIQFSRRATIVSNYAAAVAALNELLFYPGMPAFIGYTEGEGTMYLLAIGKPNNSAEGATGADAYAVVSRTSDASIIDRIKVDGDGTKFLNDQGEYVSIQAGVVSVNGKTGVVTVIEGMLTEGVTAKGVTVGNITDGTVLANGMTFTEFVKKMLVKRIPATYTQPSVAFTQPKSQTVEVGTTISAAVTLKFTKNDAGNLTNMVINRKIGNQAQEQVAQGATDPLVYQESTTVVGDAATDATVVYSGSATYAEGVIKNDNLGEPSPSGHIEAGTKNAASVTYTGKRKMFFGAFTNPSQELNSKVLRGLSAVLNPTSGTKINYSSFGVEAGTQKFVIALPKSYGRGIAKVLQQANGFNLDVTSNFVKQGTAVQVEGLNGYTAVDYDVYVWTPAAAFSDPDAFEVTLK